MLKLLNVKRIGLLTKLEINWIWIISFFFIGINACLIYFEVYWVSLVPFGIAILLAATISFEKIFWFIIFCTPLSINLEKLDIGGIGMFFPTEPILFFIMILFIFRLMLNFDYDKKVLLHPITIAILFSLFWLIITTFTSVRPIVSIKFFISRLWFVVAFYFIAIQIFRNKLHVRRYLWFYIIPMTGVIVYTVINHYFHGFDDKPAHFVMKPFFKDHTSYGAILVLYIPLIIYLLDYYREFSAKIYVSVVLLIFVVGTIFSYTRAAWLSLAGAMILWAIYRFKIKFRLLAGAVVITSVTLAFSWNTLLLKLEQNRKESSSNFSEHIQSMSNVSSDASNLERIDRWECAIKMFLEKPLFGWGPGTYMFEYAPFQNSQSLTIISTNAGRLGNAHSEYIGPLAESGLPGMLSMLMIVILTFYKGSKLYHSLPKGKDKTLILAVLLGFFTYVSHGFLNNYLDTDKASAPFWGFIGIVVAYDVYHKKYLNKLDTENGQVV